MDSLYFEVRYVGRIRVSHRKGPPTFIDDALEKFRQVEKTPGSPPSAASTSIPQQQRLQQSEGAPLKSSLAGAAQQRQQQQQHTQHETGAAASILAAAKSYLPSSPRKREVSFDDGFQRGGSVPGDEQLQLQQQQQQKRRPTSPQPPPSTASKPIPVAATANSSGKDAVVHVAVIPPTPEDRYLGSSKVPPDVRRIAPTRARAVSGSEYVPRTQSNAELDSHNNRDRRSAGPEDSHRKHSADAATPASADHKTTSNNKPTSAAASSGHNNNNVNNSPNAGGLQQSSRNKTMVLCISSTAVSIVSPDKKSELLKRSIRDISHCSQGIKKADHFGFICREPHIDLNVGYIFQCQSATIVDYIMKAMQVCFQAALEVSKQELRDAGLCEYCPLAWYDRLCALVKGLPLPRAYQILASKVDGLPEHDRDLILAKLEGGEPFPSLQEKNTLLMMLLRAHCEAKQIEHSHRLPDRNEPIEKSVSFPLILGRAKKSFLTSFDAFLKQGGNPPGTVVGSGSSKLQSNGRRERRESGSPSRGKAADRSSQPRDPPGTRSPTPGDRLPRTPFQLPRQIQRIQQEECVPAVPSSNAAAGSNNKHQQQHQLQSGGRKTGDFGDRRFSPSPESGMRRSAGDGDGDVVSGGGSRCGSDVASTTSTVTGGSGGGRGDKDNDDDEFGVFEDDRDVSPQPVVRPRSTTLSTSGGSRLKRELARSQRSSAEGHAGNGGDPDRLSSSRSASRLLVQTSPLSVSHPGDKSLLLASDGPLSTAVPAGTPAAGASSLGSSPSLRVGPNNVEMSSWRKIIFQRIVAAPPPLDASTSSLPAVLQVIGPETRKKRHWKELKFLWKKAVFRQMLLRRIEMELSKAGALAYERRVSSVSILSAERANLSTPTSAAGAGDKPGTHQQQAHVPLLGGGSQPATNAAASRLAQDLLNVEDCKLHYEDVGQTVPQDEQWALLFQADEDRLETKLLEDSVRQGVPRKVRGKVWQLLVRHTRTVEAEGGEAKPKPDLHSEFPVDTPYEDLLKQLTAQQHAILIDLARTFPTHPYFSQPLGQGQLELFNLLKAYSILDGDVGYCQGLSFIAALILMHMDEKSAWDTFLHVLVERDLRSHYVGNLGGLQLCLYQLSRLLVDRKPELAQHLDNLSAPPTLYASPWFLSIFTADFPVGFGVRVMDLVLLQGKSALIKVALVVLEKVEEELLVLESLEDIMEYLKTSLPKHSLYLANQIIQTAADLDISAQLRTYEVEYQVLQEEIGVNPAEPEPRKKDQHAKVVVSLQRHNRSLLEKLEKRNDSVQKLQGLLAHQRQVEMRMREKIRQLESNLQATNKVVQTTDQEKAKQQQTKDVLGGKRMSPPPVIKPPTASPPQINLPPMGQPGGGAVKSARMSRLSVRSASADRDVSPTQQHLASSDEDNVLNDAAGAGARKPGGPAERLRAGLSKTLSGSAGGGRRGLLERETHQFLSPTALRRAGQRLRESRSFDHSRMKPGWPADLDLDDDDDFDDDEGGGGGGSGSGGGLSASSTWPYDLSPVPVISIKPEDYVISSGGVLKVKGGKLPGEKLGSSSGIDSSLAAGNLRGGRKRDESLSTSVCGGGGDDDDGSWANYDGPRSNSEPDHRRIREDVTIALMDVDVFGDGGDGDLLLSAADVEDDATVRECRSRLAAIRRGIETGMRKLADYRKSVHLAEDELLGLRRGDVFSFGAIEELASTTAKLQSAELQLKAAGECLDKAYSHLPPNLRSLAHAYT